MVGAQWVMSTGWPIEARVFHDEKIVDEDGGHDKGGKDNICPLGRLESATEIPAM
jgi:hypothetical protein